MILVSTHDSRIRSNCGAAHLSGKWTMTTEEVRALHLAAFGEEETAAVVAPQAGDAAGQSTRPGRKRTKAHVSDKHPPSPAHSWPEWTGGGISESMDTSSFGSVLLLALYFFQS